jgi:Fic family protein
MKPYTPDRLPIKNLDWEAFLPKLGTAHALLARYDEKIPLSEKLIVKEAHSQGTLQIEKQNYQKALREIRKGAPISFALMYKLHRILKKDISVSWNLPIGKFRDRQNWIGKEGCTIEEAYFLPPEAKHLSKCMKELKNYLHIKEKDPLVQLAVFFAQLLIIHPFMDGNGRIGRILIPAFLHEKKLISSPKFFMSSYFKKRRLAYFEKLFTITSEKDWEGWIDFFLQGIIETSLDLFRNGISKEV